MNSPSRTPVPQRSRCSGGRRGSRYRQPYHSITKFSRMGPTKFIKLSHKKVANNVNIFTVGEDYVYQEHRSRISNKKQEPLDRLFSYLSELIGYYVLFDISQCNLTIELKRSPQARLSKPTHPRKTTLIKRRGSWGRHYAICYAAFHLPNHFPIGIKSMNICVDFVFNIIW